MSDPLDITRQRLVLDLMRARKNLLMVPPTAPALARLGLVRELGKARTNLLTHK